MAFYCWTIALINTKLLAFPDEIQNPVLVIHGELAHFFYFGKTAFEKLKGENKEFMQIPGATIMIYKII